MLAKRIYQSLIKFSDGIIILALPILLVILNSNWIFSPVTNFLPDAWFYTAFFRYFDSYAPVFPSNTYYFVERITWNVPGYFAYKIFSPLYANYVIHLTVCYIALFSLYGTLTLLFNRCTAILSTLLMGGYPWFLRAVGWDYVDGVGIALMLLLIYVLTLSISSQHWKLLAFSAGIIHATLLVTNLFWIGLTPGWFVYYLFISHPIAKEKAWKLIDYFVLGNLILTAVVALYYFSLTGNYFLQNSIAFSVLIAHNKVFSNLILGLYGHMPPYWHVIAVLVAVVGAWQLIRSTKTPLYRSFVATGLFFVITYSCLIFWHFYTLPYLNIFLYSSFTIPAIFLLLGALLVNITSKLSENQFQYARIAAFFSSAVPFLLVTAIPSSEKQQGNNLLIILFSFVFTLVLASANKGVVVFPIIVSFGALSFLVGANSYIFTSDSSQGRNNFTALIEASDAIDSYYPNHEYMDFRLWYRDDVHYDAFFNLSALYLYPWGSAINKPRSGKAPPAVLTFGEEDLLQKGDNIVIVSSNPDANEVIAEADRALISRNATLKLIATKEIKNDSLAFILYFTTADIKGEE
jgi:hypothetical protein